VISTIRADQDLKPEAEEIEFLRQIVAHLGVAREQAELFA
jgi:GAF domain-containing protein